MKVLQIYPNIALLLIYKVIIDNTVMCLLWVTPGAATPPPCTGNIWLACMLLTNLPEYPQNYKKL